MSTNKISIEQAKAWFNNFSSLGKTQLCDINTEIVGKCRRYETLTDIEIEEIWRKEVGDLKLHIGEQVDESYPKEFQEAYGIGYEKQNSFSLEPEKTQIVDFEPKKNEKQYSQEEVDRLLDQQAVIKTDTAY